MPDKKTLAEIKPDGNRKTLVELPALLKSLPKMSPKELEDFSKDLNESARRMKK